MIIKKKKKHPINFRYTKQQITICFLITTTGYVKATETVGTKKNKWKMEIITYLYKASLITQLLPERNLVEVTRLDQMEKDTQSERSCCPTVQQFVSSLCIIHRVQPITLDTTVTAVSVDHLRHCSYI